MKFEAKIARVQEDALHLLFPLFLPFPLVVHQPWSQTSSYLLEIKQNHTKLLGTLQAHNSVQDIQEELRSLGCW